MSILFTFGKLDRIRMSTLKGFMRKNSLAYKK